MYLVLLQHGADPNKEVDGAPVFIKAFKRQKRGKLTLFYVSCFANDLY